MKGFLKPGIQTLMNTIGDTGCLMLCLINLGQRYTGRNIDVIEIIETALEKKWLGADMYVMQPEKIMKHITGDNWSYTHANSIPNVSMEMEYYIERWEWVTPKGVTYNHFKLMNWDSLNPSPVVAHGKIVSYRILRKLP